MCLSSCVLCVLLINVPVTGLKWLPGCPGVKEISLLFLMFFSTSIFGWFFEGFLKVLASMLDDFLDDFRMFFA